MTHLTPPIFSLLEDWFWTPIVNRYTWQNLIRIRCEWFDVLFHHHFFLQTCTHNLHLVVHKALQNDCGGGSNPYNSICNKVVPSHEPSMSQSPHKKSHPWYQVYSIGVNNDDISQCVNAINRQNNVNPLMIRLKNRWYKNVG